MSTLAILFNGTTANGQFLGDQICMLKSAYLFAQNTPDVDKILLTMSPGNDLHFLWEKFIDTYKAEVIYDQWHPGDWPTRHEAWDRWRRERNIEGRPFHHLRELYLRIHGGSVDGRPGRQTVLCGGENGLGRKNIFEYMYYGQEPFRYGDAVPAIIGADNFGDELIYHEERPAEYGVLIAPHAKCQGNWTFTFEYWASVVHKLLDAGVSVTVNYNGAFCEQFNGNPLYRKIFPDFRGLQQEIQRHRLVACGNTGVGWLAFACGIPVIAMQPANSNMADYRYEMCGCKSLVEIVEQPDADYVAKRIAEEVNRVVVLTTGCFDVIHAGHVRHLEESRAMGTRLVVALNSDSSVRRLKGDGRPVNKQDHRAAVLSAIRWVDEVRIFDGDNALPLIHDLRPMVLTNGCDHKLNEIVGKEFVESYGGRVVVTSGTRDQSSTKIIATVKQADVIRAIHDAGSVSINPVGKLRLLAKELQSVVHLGGDIADLGAYRGGCSLLMRRVAPYKDLHVIDTWNGTPFDDPLCHHKVGEWKASMGECMRIVGESPLTHYWQGVFPKDVPIGDKNFSFVFVDPDTYQSVRDAIEFFWPRMVPGGKMLFDDYDWEPCAGVKKAVDEAFADRVVHKEEFACVVTKR